MDQTTIGTGDAAAGLAVPGLVPGLGTALGAVSGVALAVAPEIGHWLFGPDAAQVTVAIQQAAYRVTGAVTPDAQAGALAAPDLAARFRVELAGIAASRAAAADAAAQARWNAQLADLTNARGAAVQLAQTGSAMAWGAPIVSVLVLVTFGGVVSLVLLHDIPTASATVLNVLIGTLGAMATNVVGYWVGSSVGSARKDERLARREAS